MGREIKLCPTCKEELNLAWDEALGQLFICKNSHEFEFRYDKDLPQSKDSGLPPSNEGGGQI